MVFTLVLKSFCLKILLYLINIVVYNLNYHNFESTLSDFYEPKTEILDRNVKHEHL